MDTLTGIKVFRQVAESGTFVAAAERMDLSTAMVSKHVAHIEQRLGVRLLNRNSRALSLTEPGRVYLERCKAVLDELEATELELGSLAAAPRGPLRVSCPSWFARQRVADELAEFRRRYPQIVVDISFDNRPVDIVEEGYDLALRVTREEVPSANLIARPVRDVPVLLGASAAYLKRNGGPEAPEQLTRHDFIAVGNLDSIRFSGASGNIDVPVRVVLRYRSAVGVAHAVATGIGLAPLPQVFFEEPPFRGVVLPVLTNHPLQEETLYIVYVGRRYLPLKIRAFIDFVMERFRRTPAARPASAR